MAAREPTPLLYARCGDERGEVFSTVNTALGVGGGGAGGGSSVLSRLQKV